MDSDTFVIPQKWYSLVLNIDHIESDKVIQWQVKEKPQYFAFVWFQRYN